MRVNRLLLVGFLLMLMGYADSTFAAKPDCDADPTHSSCKDDGQTENAPGSIAINTPDTGPGLVRDRYPNPYMDWRVLGSSDCVRLVVPSRDGVDQGRVTMFHRGPSDECDASQRDDRSFGVALTDPDYDFDGDGSVEPREEGLRGQFRCWDIFADDHSGAYCRFLITNDAGDVLWNINWPEVTVSISGSDDVLTVVNVGMAEVSEAVEVAQGNSGKTKTELQSRDGQSIPLHFTVERL